MITLFARAGAYNNESNKPLKRGTSWAKNLARFTSMIARNISTLSSSSGYFSFRLPAAVNTDFTALIPEKTIKVLTKTGMRFE